MRVWNTDGIAELRRFKNLTVQGALLLQAVSQNSHVVMWLDFEGRIWPTFIHDYLPKSRWNFDRFS